MHCVNGAAIPIRLALLGARCGLCEPLVSPFAPRKNETFAERKATLIGREVPPTRKSAYEGARFLGTYLIGRLPYGYGKTCGVGLVALRTRTLRRQEAGVRRQGSRGSVTRSTYVRLSSLTRHESQAGKPDVRQEKMA